MAKPKLKTRKIVIMIDEQMGAALDAHSEKTHIVLSEIVRLALASYLKLDGKKVAWLFWVIIPDGKLGDIMPTVAAVLEFPARKAPPRRHRADRTFLTR